MKKHTQEVKLSKFEVTIRYVLVGIITAVLTVFTMNKVFAYTLIDTKGNYISSDSLVNGAIVSEIPDTDEKEPKVEISTESTAETVSVEAETKADVSSNNIYASVINSMTADERVLLEKIVAAEAQNQSLRGRMAVVEVIFNRVLDSRFPNSVYGVLSQKGQFSTWRYRNSSWVEPKYGKEAVDQVCNLGMTVLPSTRYLYFDTKGVNGKNHIRIQSHYFGMR